MTEAKWVLLLVLGILCFVALMVWDLNRSSDEHRARMEFMVACEARSGGVFTTDKPWQCIHETTGAPIPIHLPEAGK